ncbi:hypothetical protein [Helicobacter japonicus]|uniref:hypothetical protein n=1 Tax=Helicobacter japonicus TaxID=425400 RepID=UPI0032204517
MDNRKFSSTICVKNGTKRHRIECSPAEIYGGQKGLFRIRHNRKWIDTDGKKVFMNAEKIGKFICSLLENKEVTSGKPNIPKNTRCSIIIWEKDNPVQLCAMTGSEPILDYNGEWQIYVIAYGYQGFYPCKDLIIKGHNHAK